MDFDLTLFPTAFKKKEVLNSYVFSFLAQNFELGKPGILLNVKLLSIFIKFGSEVFKRSRLYVFVLKKILVCLVKIKYFHKNTVF